MPKQFPKPVTAAQIGWTPEPPQFASMVAQDLGDAGGDRDGFDAAFNAVALALMNDGNEGPILDQHLADMEFAAGAVDAAHYAPVALDLAAFQAGGDSALSGVETDTGAAAAGAAGGPPAPTPPGGTPPPQQGGGGGGGGQPAPQPGPCTTSDFPGFSCDGLLRLGPHKKGDPPQNTYFGFVDKAEPGAVTTVTSAELLSGDSAVFSVGHGPDPGQPSTKGDAVRITVQTAKTGRFNAVVRARTNYVPAGHVLCICADVYQP